MIRKALLSLGIICLLSYAVQACSCTGNNEFCSTIAHAPPDIIVTGVKVNNVLHGMEFHIIDQLAGPNQPDTIKVWGDTGALCRASFGGLTNTDTVILALHYTSYMGNNPGFGGTPGSEQPGDFEMSICGTFGLSITNGLVQAGFNRTIFNGASSMSYTDFLTTLATTPCQPATQLKIRAMLQGTYDTGNGRMFNKLNDAELLPTYQPFDQTPWNFTDSLVVRTPPSNVVDWVYIRLADKLDPSIIVDEAVGMIRKDGSIIGVDLNRALATPPYPDITPSPLNFQGLRFYQADPNESYYIFLHARSHLAVMSATPVQLVQIPPDTNTVHYDYDFTIGVQQANGTGQLVLSDDSLHSVLRAGDTDHNGSITISDFNVYVNQASALFGYYEGDCNMNGSVTIHDFNLFFKNMGVIGASPIRY